MNEQNISARLYIAELALTRIEYMLDSALNGKIQLTKDASLADPSENIWHITNNFLRHLRCLAAEGLFEAVPPEDSYEGVQYYERY